MIRYMCGRCGLDAGRHRDGGKCPACGGSGWKETDAPYVVLRHYGNGTLPDLVGRADTLARAKRIAADNPGAVVVTNS